MPAPTRSANIGSRNTSMAMRMMLRLPVRGSSLGPSEVSRAAASCSERPAKRDGSSADIALSLSIAEAPVARGSVLQSMLLVPDSVKHSSDEGEHGAPGHNGCQIVNDQVELVPGIVPAELRWQQKRQ